MALDPITAGIGLAEAVIGKIWPDKTAAEAAQLTAAAPFSVDWTLADNTVRALNAQNMLDVGRALGAHIITRHAKGRALRARIDAATTPAAVSMTTARLVCEAYRRCAPLST